MPPANPPTLAELRQIAKERLRDAKALLKAKRYDGGVYLCGYAVELALKARICKTLKWTAFPPRNNYQSFYVHNLGVLLSLSGRETAIIAKPELLAAWSVVKTWDPEARYIAVGAADEADLMLMIDATQSLLGKLL